MKNKKMKVVILVIISLCLLTSVVILVNYISSNKLQNKPGDNKLYEFNIIGKYICSNDYWKDDFFIKNPQKVPFILFESNNKCSILVNYLGGLENVKCSYSKEKDTVKVKVDLKGTPFDGTYNDGRPYMEDEYIFNIIDDNNIVIDKGFYTVNAGDYFIKK